MKLRWTRLALEDLENAWTYIVEKNPSAPALLLPRIEKSLVALKNHPYIGRAGRVPGTRELVIVGTPFILPYRIRTQSIELLAFMHGARRWPDSF
jgi:toxin ParE1/3/4